MVVREVNIIDLNAVLEKSPIPILLEICARHPICETIQSHFNELSKKFNGKIAFLRIDISRNPEVLKIFNVRIPTYIAFDRGRLLNAWYNPTPYQLTMIAKELSRLI
ncbi:MAG: thioredoxin family protein [Candidatus Njordarchaeia archaeon]